MVAITHNRLDNDKLLADRCPSIDLILGGHDHEPTWDIKHRLIKSGQNFKCVRLEHIFQISQFRG